METLKEKFNETTLKVTKPVEPVVEYHEKDTLLARKASLEASLTEVNELLADCENLNLKTLAEIEAEGAEVPNE